MTAIFVHKNAAADKVWLCREEVKWSRRKQPQAGEQHINMPFMDLIQELRDNESSHKSKYWTEVWALKDITVGSFRFRAKWSQISLNEVLDVGKIQVSTTKAATFQPLIKDEGSWCFTANAFV